MTINGGIVKDCIRSRRENTSGTTISESSSMNARALLRYRRRSFLVFVRILLKCIEQSGDKALACNVRKIVERCITEHRTGLQEQDKSLVETVEAELRVVVGEEYWVEARVYLKHYHQWKKEGMIFCAV